MHAAVGIAIVVVLAASVAGVGAPFVWATRRDGEEIALFSIVSGSDAVPVSA